MTHWRLTPKQLEKLTEDELEVMSIGFRLCEKRNLENLSDLIGTLLGSSWSVDALTSEEKPNLEDKKFSWSKRPPRHRISLPLSLVIGGNKIMDHVKKQAMSIKAKEKDDPSILSLPSASVLKDTEVVNMSHATKEEFLNLFENIENKVNEIL